MKIKLKSKLLLFLYILSHGFFAQNIGVNATVTTPHSSAILNLNSGNTFTAGAGKGFLPPNVAITNRLDVATIPSPATSLLIHNTNISGAGTLAVTTGYYYYYYWDGSIWVAPGGNDWHVTGNIGTTAGTNFLGTTDNQNLVFKRNNLQSGLLSTLNTSYGVSALKPLSTSVENTALGVNALLLNTVACDNVALGDNSLRANTIA